MKAMDTLYKETLETVQPEVRGLYQQILNTVETIANTHLKKRIPTEFSSELRAILCYYFKDVNEFHIQGMSGINNDLLKQSYEKVITRLTEIQTKMSKEAPLK